MDGKLDINLMDFVIGLFGFLIGLGSVLVALIQTKRLNEVKRRSEADLIESIRTTRKLLQNITHEKNDIEKKVTESTAKDLHEKLIKELVIRRDIHNQKGLMKLKEGGKIKDNEVDIATTFIRDTPSRFEFFENIGIPLIKPKSQPELLQLINKLGIIDIPKDFPLDLIKKGIAEANHKVKISTTWIHGNKLRGDIAEAIKKETCSVEILLLNPKENSKQVCPFKSKQKSAEQCLKFYSAAEQRSFDLGKNNSSSVPQLIHETLENLKASFSKTPNNKKSNKLALYETAPVFIMYLFDDTLVWCSAFHDKDGNTIACGRRQFVIKGMDSEFYKTMEDQFNLLASRSESIFPVLESETTH